MVVVPVGERASLTGSEALHATGTIYLCGPQSDWFLINEQCRLEGSVGTDRQSFHSLSGHARSFFCLS